MLSSRIDKENTQVALPGLRLAFILPRFFPGVIGGAETLAGQLALHAELAGAIPEIWTTCAADNRTWENSFPEGVELWEGIPIRRFLVDERDLHQWIPLQIRLSEGLPLTVEEQLTWMKESVNSQNLYSYIANHGKEFDLLLFGPYLFGTTFWGSLIYPERSLLIPCLHNEPNAYLDIIASMFRTVRGCVFNAEAEQTLAHELYGSKIAGGVVGLGFSPPQNSVKSKEILPDSPFALYLGRMETGKNVHIMLDYFVSAKEEGLLPPELILCIAGGGSFEDLGRKDYEQRGDIFPLGRVSEEEKQVLLEAALVLVQPSTNESFCIVMMEGWQLGTPALVHQGCDVTREHAIQADGGLYFKDRDEFAATLRFLYDNPDTAKRLGEAGREYVKNMYSWEAVMGRFASLLGEMVKERVSPVKRVQKEEEESCVGE